MICEPGKCCVCEKDIAAKCPTCGARGKSNDFTQVEVKWSNGSIMPIGVCNGCAVSNAYSTDAAKKGITEAHWKYWDAQGGSYDKAVVIV